MALNCLPGRRLSRLLSGLQRTRLPQASAAANDLAHVFAMSAYPTRPVRVIVPITPAGAADIVARLIGQWLSERLGQPFIIENRPGAGTNIGTKSVVRAPADGYTLLLVSVPNAINATLYDRLNFNFIRDIAPVAGINREPHCRRRLCRHRSRPRSVFGNP